jgi:arsenate reductase
MDRPMLYHNPRCSKSRAALALLEERGVEVDVIEYLAVPPSRAALADLRAKLGRPVAEWIRKTEPAFQEAGLSDASSEDDLLAAIAAHPILLERPILVHGERAIVGRPPQRILELLP